MNKKSIAKNSILNIVKTLVTYVFPLITFMYASRIFLSDGIGQINFAQSYTAYFCLFGMLGIEKYGIRETAGLRDDPRRLSHFAHELMILNCLSVVLAYVLFFITVFSVARLERYRILLYINSVSIALTAMAMNWLYVGVEDYKYITIRSIIVNGISLVLLFLLVRRPEDIYTFVILNTVAATGANIFNLIHSRKYIQYRNLGNYHPFRHLRPVLVVFGMTLFIELFSHMDTTMLGFLSGDHATGLYGSAHKVNGMITAVITAAAMVLMPRIAFYAKQNQQAEIRELSGDAVNLIMMLSIPAAVGVICLSKQLVVVLSGESFAEASLTAKILAGRLLLSSLNAFIVLMLFIPLGKEKINVLSTGAAAVLNFIFNSALIPSMAQNGAAIATVVAESVELLVSLIFLHRVMPLRPLFRNLWQYVLASGAVAVICVVVGRLIHVGLLAILFAAAVSALMYFAILFALKNPYLMPVLNKVTAKLKSR